MGVKGYAIHLSFSPGNSVLNAYKPSKSTRTQGGDPIADYIRADTRLPAYLPYPRFLLKMEISQTAKLLYSLLLDRSTLSQKNKWLDDEGRIYIIYPIAEIAEILDKGSTTIKGALNELDMAGLLERERGGFSAPNRLYVKVPPVPQVQFSDQLMAGSPPLIEPENRPTDGQKTDLMMVGKPSPNQTTINNLTESQTKGVSGGPSAPYALMKSKIIGVCPNCGKPVVEREKGWFCENRECRFVLWKDNAFFKRLGKRLDAHVADKLLRDGRVRLKDCKSAKGKTYNATVLLSCEADGRSKFSLEFEGGC